MAAAPNRALRDLVVLLAVTRLVACRSAAPVPPPAPPPAAASARAPEADWKTNGGLTQDEGDARCRAELPGCAHAFGMYWLPPSPCANRGTRCMDMPDLSQGRWSCGCDLCAGSADCKPGEHCGTGGDPCSTERRPVRCLPGPAPRCADPGPRLPPP